jgi:hypothetical protein
MGNIAESTPAVYTEHVYQVENGDPATGGASGTFVLPSKALADRTKWLKEQVEALDAAKAPLASPALTGVPTAPTAADGTSTTQLATTAFVASALVGGAVPTATESLAGKVELATAAETQAGADGTRAVHPAGLKSALDLKAPLASPGLTGTPTAPTAAAGTNTTQVATTAFVATAVASVAVATETVRGAVELATGAETLAGTDNTRAVHPAGLKAAFPNSLASDGYQKLPGGLILQWGQADIGIGKTTITFPLAFSAACLVVMTTDWAADGVGFNNQAVNAIAATYFVLRTSNAAGSDQMLWFAVGY